MFSPIDFDSWDRKEHFQLFTQVNVCNFSINKEIEVTRLLSDVKKSGYRFYGAMIYINCMTVNSHSSMRVGRDEKGGLGVWETMHPMYTIFDKAKSLFSFCWTEFDANFEKFHTAFNADVSQYSTYTSLMAKPGIPKNCFLTSAIPWTEYTSFNFDFRKGGDYFPLINFGKYIERSGRYFLPYTLRVHHAVADAFHATHFLDEIQDRCHAGL